MTVFGFDRLGVEGVERQLRMVCDAGTLQGSSGGTEGREHRKETLALYGVTYSTLSPVLHVYARRRREPPRRCLRAANLHSGEGERVLTRCKKRSFEVAG